MKLESGHELVPVEPEVDKVLKGHFAGFRKFGSVRVIPGDFYTSEEFKKMANEMYNFPVLPTDVFVTSYLKTGSTWMQEVVWAILHNPDLDHPDSDKDSYAKCPWFEMEASLPKSDMPALMVANIPEDISLFQSYAMLPSPRVFKTHILFSLQNPDVLDKAKVVYVIRDPRDTCVSYYHFARGVRVYGYSQPLDQFVDDYIAGNVFLGSYVNHLRQWWPVRNKPNVYTIYYENVQKNPAVEMEKLGKFLGVDLNDKQIQNVIKYTSFAEMKKRDILQNSKEARDQFMLPESEGFFRKGVSASSKTELTPEMSAKIAKHFRENLGEIELPYDFN